MVSKTQNLETLQGTVERITYYNPENGYSVIRIRPATGRARGMNRQGLVTAVGNLPELSPGENVLLHGNWRTHSKHGLQFQIQTCQQQLPATLSGIKRYLGSGLVKGIGPRLAEKIVSHFGKETLEIIENEPERLREVPDIGPKRSLMIASAWEEQKQVKEIMLFLHSHQISTNLAIKIYKQYGDEALNIVRSDPYRLAQDIYGVGFKTADRIAQDLGLPSDHPSRIEAGVVYTLNQFTDNGNVYMPKEELVEEARALLGTPAETIPPALERLSLYQRIHEDSIPYQYQAESHKDETSAIAEAPQPYKQPAIYLSPLYYSEISVARRIRELAKAFPTRLSDIPPVFLTLSSSLTDEQSHAIRTTLSHPICVLTGGPGTGKTTTIRSLIQELETSSKRYALASPTGRAAKRLSQATERPASTIHRLLGFSPKEGFKYNSKNPLPLDFLVVDEASMLDLILANNLLKAIEPGTHLLLVGDVDQLPSVGAGDVLRDIIDSGFIPVIRLNKIFRQAAHSQIILNAHRINKGKMPVFSSKKSSQDIQRNDFYYFPAETPEDAAKWLIDIVCHRIPDTFGFIPLEDIQVLSPMYRGPVGVNSLNERLQNRLNPMQKGRAEKTLFGQIFRQGDKLMQIRNNYDKGVFNGDIGRLIRIDEVQQELIVDFEGRHVSYDWSDADQLVMAYAVSVHKAQGSEFPVVVIPLITQHYIMLQRNLLYTAITRASKLCVLVGSQRAISLAVRNDKVAKRFSALDWRLNELET